MIRILLVDDEASVRVGLRMRLGLEPDVTIVGEANDGIEALELARILTPDIAVMDVEMQGMDGINATERLCEFVPSISVVILSIHGDADTRQRALAAGAKAFVEKQGSVDQLLRAIRRAAQ
jgi:DNA-binding NarL/FixJ family response regulator